MGRHSPWFQPTNHSVFRNLFGKLPFCSSQWLLYR